MNPLLHPSAHSALATLLAGLATVAGCAGLGRLALRAVRLSPPLGLKPVVATLLGIEIASIAVQTVAMANVATHLALIGIWCVVAACSAAVVPSLRRARRLTVPKGAWPALAVIFLAAGFNLVAALAPSSKIDELYYHMLVPSRIVADTGLRFYRMPWEAAIVPQMSFQIFAAPLHAMELPDAANVVSWGLSLMLAWFGWSLLTSRSVRSPLAYWCTAAMLVGMYPVVSDVTGGAHAFGDLAMAAGVVAVALADELLASQPPAAFLATLSLLMCFAASSKLSLWPLAGTMVLLGVAVVWKRGGERIRKLQLVGAALLPWLVFLAPLACWTFAHSGSPLGPVMTGMFGVSAYDPAWVRDVIHGTQAANQVPLLRFLADTFVNYSPLIWLGVVGLIVAGATPRVVRIAAAAATLSLLVLIWVFLPHQARFLGGLHYGLLLLFACLVVDRLSSLSNPRVLAATAWCLVLPWLVVQGVYARQFVPVVLGLERVEAFCDHYVAFYRDFHNLDRILPGNAVLLAPDFRAPSVYAPRPMLYDALDLPAGRPVFLFGATAAKASDLPPDFEAVREVYSNPMARCLVYRTPGKQAVLGPLHVTQLGKKPAPAPSSR